MDLEEHGCDAYDGFQILTSEQISLSPAGSGAVRQPEAAAGAPAAPRTHAEASSPSAMEMIVAFIRPECLQKVKEELYSRKLYSMSITSILGAGRQGGYMAHYRGVTTQVNLHKKLRLEICIPEGRRADVFEAVARGARTGREGDGVIFAMDVAKCERIRTGEMRI